MPAVKKQSENKVDFTMRNHQEDLNSYRRQAQDVDPEILRARREKLNGIRDREIEELEERLGIDGQPIHSTFKSSGVYGTTAHNSFQGPTIRGQIFEDN